MGEYDFLENYQEIYREKIEDFLMPYIIERPYFAVVEPLLQASKSVAGLGVDTDTILLIDTLASSEEELYSLSEYKINGVSSESQTGECSDSLYSPLECELIEETLMDDDDALDEARLLRHFNRSQLQYKVGSIAVFSESLEEVKQTFDTRGHNLHASDEPFEGIDQLWMRAKTYMLGGNAVVSYDSLHNTGKPVFLDDFEGY
jgi:hypothetical protein